MASIVIEFAKGHAGAASARGRQLVNAFSGLVARNRRRYGGYVVHAAIVLLAIGVAGSVALPDDEGGQALARPVDGSGRLHDHVPRADTRSAVEPHGRARPRRRLPRRGARLPARAGKNRYAAEHQVSSEMAIYTSWLRAEDVDVIADQINPDQSVHFKVLVKPLVNLIWLAGFVFVGGALIALWPDARESRRFAERYERAVGVKA